MKIILATDSKRRIELLNSLGVEFRVISSGYEECDDINKNFPGEVALHNASAKANKVAKNQRSGIIIAADTIVYKNGVVYGKPADVSEAKEMLDELAGGSHSVCTGVSVIDAENKTEETDVETTVVHMRELTESEIDVYLSLINPLDKAGGYAIQTAGSLIIDGIEGCYYNVVGMPIALIDRLFHKFGFSIFDMIKKESNKI